MALNIIFYIPLVILLGLILLHYYIRGGKRGALMNKIPGLQPLPLVGNASFFFITNEHAFYKIVNLNKEYYPIHKLWFINKAVVTIMHPDDAEILLSSKKYIEKSSFYDFLRPWFADGLLTSTGQKWQTRRKILTPAFHFSVLQKFVLNFEECAKHFVELLKTHKGPFVQDIVPLMTGYTLNVICETAMGVSLDTMDTIGDEYRKAVHVMGQTIAQRLFKPWMYIDWAFYLTSVGRTQAKALKILHGFTKKIIGERIQYHDTLEVTGNSHAVSSDGEFDGNSEEKAFEAKKKEKMAMLDLLISAWKQGGQIDLSGIREEVDTFMFEGHDTTAVALMYSILCLAEHPSIQNRCREEVDAVLHESGGKLGVSELQRLCYLEQCVKESLRLFPSVPVIGREITEDLPLKDYVVPAGTTVQLHIFSLHRDPNFWEDPEVFDPDRFSPDRLKERHPFSYIPFSAGPRNCIGQKFAMYELKGLIAHVIHEFILEPVDSLNEVRFLTDLVLRSTKPIKVKFIPRDH